MATSVFPEVHAGGLEVRDGAGNPANPVAVEKAYSPLPAFISTCPITALPSDCNARIEPRQINAIVSELVSFAECLDPTGPWDCNSLKNLCAAFQEWMLVNITGTIISDTIPPAQPKPILWWESDTGRLFIWYDDVSSQQWVQVGGPSSIAVDMVSIIGAGTPSNPHAVGLVDGGTY